MSRTEMRRWSFAPVAVLLAASLLPLVSARAQETGRVKASQLVKSVVMINTIACDTPPVPNQKAPVPFQEQACDSSGWKGSGSVIDQHGHILTNDHVIRPDRHGSDADPKRLGWYLIYQTLDSKELPVALFYARPIVADDKLDLAILEPAWGLDGQPLAAGSVDNTLPVLPLAKSGGTVQLEDTLRLLGYPRAHPQITASTVTVVGFETDQNVPQLGNTAWIRTDVAAAGPGNSGGPAVNDAGQQVGVVSAGSRNNLECHDYNGDGKIDPVSECVTAAGGAEYVRPIPEGYDLLVQQAQTPGPQPTPTTTAPPAETPTSTAEAPQPPAAPTETPTAAPTQAPAPSPTPQQQGPDTSAGTAIIIGTLVSADTGDPIARAQVVVLKPGISVKDWRRGNVGNEAIFTYTTTDARGNFQLPDPVQRNVGYSIWLQAKGYQELFKDNKVLATDADPAIVDLGTIAMPAQV